MPTDAPSIAVLGLGAMGSRISAKLAESHPVTVWNRTPERATTLAAEHPVRVAGTAAEAASSADIIVSMVRDDDAARAIWSDADLLAALPDGAVAVESSTISPSTTAELADDAARAGRAFVAAPVVGSRPQADAGMLLVLAGGDPTDVDRVRLALDGRVGTVRHVGAARDAATWKLAINGLFAAQVAAYAETVGMLVRADIDESAAVELLSALPITSPGLQRILGLIGNRQFAPNFPIELVAKDLTYLTELAADVGARAPVAERTAEVFHAAAHGDDAELDIAGIANRYL